MRCPWWSALILAGCIVGIALGAGEQDELERNRRLLDRWRVDQEHFARLLRDLRAFHALPRSRQEQLRDLDQQLFARDVPTQTRLWAALERYNAWLETLTDEQRRHILQAPDATTRLARIREQRLREWLARLPTGEQQEVSRLPAEQQPDRIATLRIEERRQRAVWYRDWLAAKATIPQPTRMSELPTETRAFVDANLMKHLTFFERKAMGELEGRHPEWLRRLLDLAEKHPVLPPLPQGEIKSLDDLSKVKGAEKLMKKTKGGLSKLKGQWPEFALLIHRIAQEKNIQLGPLGASKPDEFPREVQLFLKRDLLPTLNNELRTRLEKTEGKWPDYPLMLHRLAREKRLVIPGMSLPGPVEMWDNVRARGPAPVRDNRTIRFVREEHAKKDEPTSSP